MRTPRVQVAIVSTTLHADEQVSGLHQIGMVGNAADGHVVAADDQRSRNSVHQFRQREGGRLSHRCFSMKATIRPSSTSSIASSRPFVVSAIRGLILG